MGKSEQRYVVSDLGFGFAVQDTQDRQEYAFRAGREMKHLSTNQLNTSRVGIYPNLAEAVRIAMELNAAHAKGKRAS